MLIRYAGEETTQIKLNAREDQQLCPARALACGCHSGGVTGMHDLTATNSSDKVTKVTGKGISEAIPQHGMQEITTF